MKTTAQIKRQARHLHQLCLFNGFLNEGRVRQVVRQILEERRRGYLALLSQFKRLVRLDLTAHMAEVETAAPIPADLQASVQARLTNVYGRGVSTHFTVQPALIGGMRIRVGNDVYDGSILSGLVTLQKSFGIANTNGWSKELRSPTGG
jgi:F0F1-type ATP synthase, delta subunit (mitochondrial oligomycin sensitivity protein)